VRDRTLEGQWWLPGREDDKITGVVTYDGSDPVLELNGVFRSWDEGSLGPLLNETIEHVPLLLGSCDGKAVMLLGCQQRRFQRRFGAAESWRQTFDARLMLVGDVWLDEPEEEYFDKIVLGIDHLLAWSRQSGLERQYEQVDGRWSASTVKWEQPGASRPESETHRCSCGSGAGRSRSLGRTASRTH
jgi:hypothetical protein